MIHYTNNTNNTNNANILDTIQTHPHTDVKLKMDYKLILESQYITKRICEIAQRPLEIGFVYGGTITTTQNDTNSLTTIDMKQIAIPKKQRVTATTFDFSTNTLREVEAYFQKRNLTIAGQGHSHQHLDVFHSGVDIANYAKMTAYCGTAITPHKKERTRTTLTPYKSFSKRLNKTIQRVKKTYKTVIQKPAFVLPSLVFNTRDEITQGLAVNNLKETTVIENCPIEYYNKNAVLTIEEKQKLDKDVYAILRENNIPFQYTLISDESRGQEIWQKKKNEKTAMV